MFAVQFRVHRAWGFSSSIKLKRGSGLALNPIGPNPFLAYLDGGGRTGRPVKSCYFRVSADEWGGA